MGNEKPTYFVNMGALVEIRVNFAEKWCDTKIFSVERVSV